MAFHRNSCLSVVFACSFLLAGCQTPAQGMKAKNDPIPLQKENIALSELPVLPAPVQGDDRMAQLEQQVEALRREMAAARPKFAKIDLIEQKFKDLSLGLDRIDATYNTAPAASAPATQKQTAEPAKPPEKTAVKAQVKKAEKPSVKAVAPANKTVRDLRIGEQKNGSRLVLDLGQPAKVTYDIDNAEKILVVDIPGFSWKAPASRNFPNSAMVASYQASSDEKGARLIVQMRKAAKVANFSSIGATGGKSPRAVLDIVAQ